MTMHRILVLGTRNRKKLGELLHLLGPHGFELHTLDTYPQATEVEETGTTFGENAALKATQLARQLGQWVLGEDSGLSVDALNGAPGVYSARFAGPGATDESNNRLLLEKLAGVPAERRTGFYTCHMALSNPAGEVVLRSEERCRGRIRMEASGSGGFGYDPLFEITEYHRTFGELSPYVKSVLSHRSRAVQHFVAGLLQLIASGGWPTSS